MKVFVLKAFPFAADGINSKILEAGSVSEVNDTAVPGLRAAGFITTDDDVVAEYRRGKALSLENTAITGAPETQNGQVDPSKVATSEGPQTVSQDDPVEIPEAWADLPWPDLRALAAKVSEEPIKDKDGAIDAITAELAARGQAPDQD